MADTQEQYNAQLDELVKKIQELQKEKAGLECRLDSVLEAINEAYEKAVLDTPTERREGIVVIGQNPSSAA